MTKHKVVHGSNLPVRPPVSFTMALWLLLDRYRHPAWIDGAVWVVMGVVWVSALIVIFGVQKPTKIWDEEK